MISAVALLVGGPEFEDVMIAPRRLLFNGCRRSRTGVERE
jgi:hypothetical protein